MLAELDAAPPYVLVGHSFGGLPARLFAATYPEDVAGLILLDANHEDFFERMPEAMRDAAVAQINMLEWGRTLKWVGLPRLLFPPLAARGLPPETQAMANALGRRYETYKTVQDEAIQYDSSADSMRRAPRLPADLPIVVLSRTRPEPWPKTISPEKAEKIWAELQKDFESLSANVRHVAVANSGHYIAIDQPDAVIDAVRDLWERVRAD
jgi:pimeloyl-ACP methyl ester carboxylesterase